MNLAKRPMPLKMILGKIRRLLRPAAAPDQAARRTPVIWYEQMELDFEDSKDAEAVEDSR